MPCFLFVHVQTCVHTDMHVHRCTCEHACVCTDMQVQMCMCTDMCLYRYAHVQTYICKDMHVHRHACVRACMCTDMCMCRHSCVQSPLRMQVGMIVIATAVFYVVRLYQSKNDQSPGRCNIPLPTKMTKHTQRCLSVSMLMRMKAQRVAEQVD